MTRREPAERTYPVIEVFGPTVQGEGIVAGVPTYFIRFGGCDYRCEWCDSLYAVLPALVREHAEKLTASAILDRIRVLPVGPYWVTLSGGNPALLELAPVVAELRADNYSIAVETQGSRWRPWLGDVQSLTVSPKPPSSGMADKTAIDLPRFMEQAAAAGRPGGADKHGRYLDAVKVVVFDDNDLAWAADIFRAYPEWRRFLSCGTTPPAEDESYEDTLRGIGDRYRWLCETVAANNWLSTVTVLPQLHVIAWGHQRGV